MAGKPIFNDDVSRTANSDTYSRDGVTVHYKKAVGETEEQIEVKGPLQIEAEAKVSMRGVIGSYSFSVILRSRGRFRSRLKLR